VSLSLPVRRAAVGFWTLLWIACAGCGLRSEPGWSPPPSEIYAASYIGAVVRSLDGGRNWLELGSDPQPLMAYRKALALGGEGQIFVATSGGGLYVLQADDGPYVDRSSGLHPGNIRCLAFDPEHRVLWAGTWGSGVFVSADGGRTWSSTNDGLTAYHVNCLVPAAPVSDRVYCGTTDGLFVKEGQDAWTAVPGVSGVDARTFLIQPDGTEMYVGLGWGGEGPNVLASHDGGQTWKPADERLPTGHVFCLACDVEDGRLFAGTDRGVYQKTRGNPGWRRLGGNLPEARVFSLATAEGHCLAATARGLFGIARGATRWTHLSYPLAPSAVTDVLVRPLARAPAES